MIEIPEPPNVITMLADLPETSLISVDGMAELLKITTRTVRRMEDRGELPPHIRMGGRKYFLSGRVVTWLVCRAEQVESEHQKKLQVKARKKMIKKSRENKHD